MNPNVGRIVNGNAVLDRATFTRIVETGILTNLAKTPYNSWGRPVIDANFNVTDSRDFPGMYTSGKAFFTPVGMNLEQFIMVTGGDNGGGEGAASQVTYEFDAGAAQAYMASAFANPVTLFILDSEEPGNIYHNRRRTLYYRKNDVVLPISTKSYYESSGWVDNRAGVIFVFGSVFTLVGAPVLTAELGSIAAGEGITAAAAAGATASNTAIIANVANNFAQILGNPDIALIGKAAKLGGLASGSVTPDTLADTSEQSTMFEDISFDESPSSPFDPWNYSSGESDFAYSDAQWNDYGFGVIDGNPFDPNDITGFNLDPTNIVSDDDMISMNSTPEVTTNDFGTTFDGPTTDGIGGGSNWGGETTHLIMGAAPIAKSLASSAKDPNPVAKTTTSNVARSTSGTDILSTIGSMFKTGAAVVGGAVTQAQSAVPRTYSGQLQAQGGSTVNAQSASGAGISITTIAVVGGVLIGIALLLHARG